MEVLGAVRRNGIPIRPVKRMYNRFNNKADFSGEILNRLKYSCFRSCRIHLFSRSVLENRDIRNHFKDVLVGVNETREDTLEDAFLEMLLLTNVSLRMTLGK